MCFLLHATSLCGTALLRSSLLGLSLLNLGGFYIVKSMGARCPLCAQVYSGYVLGAFVVLAMFRYVLLELRQMVVGLPYYLRVRILAHRPTCPGLWSL